MSGFLPKTIRVLGGAWSSFSPFFNSLFPNISSITPSTGTLAGGTSVTLSGTGFVDGSIVTVGGVEATNIVFVSPTTLTFTAPAGTIGNQSVVVTNPSGQASLDNEFSYFTYVAVITSIDMDLGDLVGGELRTLTGVGFTGQAITVAGGAVTHIILSDTTAIVIMPAHAAGMTTVEIGGASIAYEYWSPASLSLTGYWDRGNYQDVTAGTWPGRASLGSSAGRDLTQGTAASQPAEVNLEPDFDGTNDFVSNATAMSTMVSAAAGTIVAVFLGGSAAAPSVGYNEESIFAETQAYMALTFTTSGVGAMLYDATSRKIARAAAAVGAEHLAVMRWNGATLGVAVDGGAEATAACGNLANLTGTTRVGPNYDLGAWFDGAVRTLLVSAECISDANAAKLLKWAKACRGLPQ